MKSLLPLIICAVALLLFAPLSAADGQPPPPDQSSGEKLLVSLKVNPREWIVAVYIDEQENVYTIPVEEVVRTDEGITCGDQVEINAEKITIAGYAVPMQSIKRIIIQPGTETSEAEIRFLAADTAKAASRFRRKTDDRMIFVGPVIIETDAFVRGSVICFSGDVDIWGEVNEDVVAVNGDIQIRKGAVVRGDVLAMAGSVRTESGASIYGEVRSSEGTVFRRSHAKRWKRDRYHDEVQLVGAAYYNRVDGATLFGGVAYEHADSIIPSFEAKAGYGFASTRWRYSVTLTQTLLRRPFLAQLGGQAFRLLKSDDEKFIGETENSLFVILVNEDWKDYYESEGAYGFARIEVLEWNRLEIGYLSEKQRWLDAHPNLWSLFGAKTFRRNFSSVPTDSLTAKRAGFDDRQIAGLLVTYTIDRRDDDKRPHSGWYGFARYEYAPREWPGDFDFRRFEARIKRFQPLNRYLSLDITGAYGRVAGDDIPLSRYFYLGGLGTVHGYGHKSMMGTEYVLTSAEYRFDIPHSNVSPFVQYDGGKILDGVVAGDDRWYSSISLGLDLDRSFRIFISKRLDRSDEDPIFYARFTAVVL
jgi:hypothetical protein